MTALGNSTASMHFLDIRKRYEMFENNLIPDPKWEPIPQIETSTIAKGGLGGAANAQALALLNNIEKTRKHSVLVFDTRVEAQSPGSL